MSSDTAQPNNGVKLSAEMYIPVHIRVNLSENIVQPDSAVNKQAETVQSKNSVNLSA
jgi:hypothetical protein